MRSTHLLSRMRVAAFAALTVIIIAACQTVEETGRKQFNVLKPGDEARMGMSEFDKYKEKLKLIKPESLGLKLLLGRLKKQFNLKM